MMATRSRAPMIPATRMRPPAPPPIPGVVNPGGCGSCPGRGGSGIDGTGPPKPVPGDARGTNGSWRPRGPDPTTTASELGFGGGWAAGAGDPGCGSPPGGAAPPAGLPGVAGPPAGAGAPDGDPVGDAPCGGSPRVPRSGAAGPAPAG